ncbi:MAG: polysaccharide pyruvyl transferase family protein [Pseudonocardiaceae bacterium]
MTSHALTRRRRRPPAAGPRVGLFGLLGAGNVGNDGSLEAVLAYLRAEHPDAVLGCLCSGPEQVRARYGIPATPLHWYDARPRATSRVGTAATKAVGKVLDAYRTLAWVRRQDVVIVPGTGVLEATLPLRPWGFPYALFLLCASGRLLGTRIALLNVGSEVIDQRLTRWLITSAARLVHYRSFRDTHSQDAMRRMGVDTSGDEVYADLTFSLPPSAAAPAGTGTVGVGVMAWHGGNGDRGQAEEIHTAYVATMKHFVRWLVDHDRRVRLFTGDQLDEVVVREIIADIRAYRPGVEPSPVVSEQTTSLDDLMRQMASVDTVVATRYHNVVCALRLAKPTVSISYSAKSDALMAEMGLADFCQPAHFPDVERLIEQFTALERQSGPLRHTMVQRNRAIAQRLAGQYSVLSATLFPLVQSAPAAAGTQTAAPDLS